MIPTDTSGRCCGIRSFCPRNEQATQRTRRLTTLRSGRRHARRAGNIRRLGLRPLDEGVEPLISRERMRCQAAELPEFSNHVGLIAVAKIERCLRPIHIFSAARIDEPRLKAGEPTVQFWRDTDPVAKQTRQMLSRNAGFASETVHRHPATPPNNGRRQPRHIHGGVRSAADLPFDRPGLIPGRRCAPPRGSRRAASTASRRPDPKYPGERRSYSPARTRE